MKYSVGKFMYENALFTYKGTPTPKYWEFCAKSQVVGKGCTILEVLLYIFEKT